VLHIEKPPRAAKLALGLLKRSRRLPPDAEAPSLDLDVTSVPIAPQDLASWRAACGYSAGDAVPLPYLFVLAFYSQAALLLDRRFPLSPTGMVHLNSMIEMYEPLKAGDELSLKLRLLGWRRVRLGREVEVEIRYFKRGWHSRGPREVARGVQTSLGRGGGTGEPRPDGPRPGPPEGDYETWSLEAATGRRYAKVSGDWNPIHLWPLTAKPFGYRRPIAHGMYLVSRACAALAAAGEDAGQRLDVRFKTPADLPGEARFYRRGDGFELWKGDGSRPHSVGRFEAL